jgi:CDP-glucose 4,6-dehydratase
VLEPLEGYLTLARKLWQQAPLAGAYNFGPDLEAAVPVRDLVEMARTAYGNGEVRYCNSEEGPHEAAWLALDIAKSREALDVRPKLTLTRAIDKTMAWYRAQGSGANALALCRADIAAYEALA